MRFFNAMMLGAALLAFSGCGGDQETTQAAKPEGVAPEIGVSAPFADVDGARISDPAPGEWLSYGRTYDEQRHSPLDQINTESVADLGVAWTYDLATGRGVEATPIVVDGTMYVTSAWSMVYALDAVTGAEKWVYDPGVDRAHGVNACCDVVNRGVAVWQGKVFVGTIDGRLEALNAETGEVIWSTVTVDQEKPYTITGAPRVVKGKVLIGNGGAEMGVRGYVSAYDVDAGELVWRFYTTPNPEKKPDGAASDSVFAARANDSWGDEGEWVNSGGGGTVWDSIIYDEISDRIIFGVGNGSPWHQGTRDPSLKDNLFLSSIVAVDADTGEYAWHFQTTPGESWDYTATQTLILADLALGREGDTRRVVMQAPKNGFFYVLDAATGEFISGDAFVPMNWATGLDETGRPIEIESARYGATPVLLFPGPLGAHNWHPMAFNADLKLAYIPAQEVPQVMLQDAEFPLGSGRWNTGIEFSAGVPTDVPEGFIAMSKAMLKGRLIAWDPVARAPRWSVEHNNAWNGGVLSTAGGLVFQGQLGGKFSAYDAATGELKWQADVKSGAASGPATYEIDGVQYVTITTGWGSAYALVLGVAYDEPVPPAVGKVVTFKLGGTGTIPEPQGLVVERTIHSERFGDAAMIDAGNVAFSRNCGVCHGTLAISSGVTPDLRWSPYTANPEAWNIVVGEGALASNGMVGFSDILSPEEIESIRAYVVAQAHANADAKE